MSSTNLYIKAAPGMKFTVEGKPKVRISDTKPIAVTPSHYYRKAIMDSDLIELTAQEWADYQASIASAQSGAASVANVNSTAKAVIPTGSVPAAASAPAAPVASSAS
jgi:hypothetical protein